MGWDGMDLGWQQRRALRGVAAEATMEERWVSVSGGLARGFACCGTVVVVNEGARLPRRWRERTAQMDPAEGRAAPEAGWMPGHATANEQRDSGGNGVAT